MLFRLACPNDAQALLRLNAAFNGVNIITVADIRHSLLSSAETVVVAEASGEVVGFCCAQVHHSFCYPAPVAEVTEMYVDIAHRRQGLALGMLRFLEEHLQRTLNVDEIHLLTSTSNLAAQSVYTRAGFTVKNEVYMTKEVPRKR